MKVCDVCGRTEEVVKFYPRRRICKDCVYFQQTIYNSRNRAKIKKRKSAYQKSISKEKRQAYRRAYYVKHRDQILAKAKLDALSKAKAVQG
jgi:recombinational DNA repair protein (RecF pathway)